MSPRSPRAQPPIVGFLPLVVLALVLAACQSTPAPDASDLERAMEALVDTTHVTNDDMRVRFLPPIGHARPHLESDQGLAIEVMVFNVDPHHRRAGGAPLGPTLSTADGSIVAGARAYRTVWQVGTTVANRKATSYVRLEFRLAGQGTDPVCNTASDACLGYLDVRIDRSRAHHGTLEWAPEEVETLGSRVPRGFLRVSNKGRLTIRFKVTPLPAKAPPESLGELTTIATGAAFDEQAGNCAASEFARPGQGLQAVGAGLQAVGAVGGLFTGATADFAPHLTTTGSVGSQVRSALASSTFTESVAILVVDDFGGTFTLPPALYGDGTVDLQALVDQGLLKHGTLVLNQLRELAGAALPTFSTFSGTNPRIDGDPYDKWHDRKGHYLMIQAVDVAGLDTDAVADRIRDAIGFIGANGGIGITRIVVNMSFAVVPCAVVGDVASAVSSTSGIPNFEAYVAALARVNGIGDQYLDELGALVSTPLDVATEPLFAYLACPLPSGTGASARCDGMGSGKHAKPTVKSIVHVAAAGNFGNDYALYPAAWPTVVSVGSLDVVGLGYGADRSAFSNAATVLAPGNAFSLTSRNGRTVAYAGTSFAAPVVSLFTALDEMVTVTRCDAGGLAGASATAPSLAGAQLSEYPLVSAFAAAPGTVTALEALCGGG